MSLTPTTLNPKPYPLNPKPYPLNPKPYPLNPKDPYNARCKARLEVWKQYHENLRPAELLRVNRSAEFRKPEGSFKGPNT